MPGTTVAAFSRRHYVAIADAINGVRPHEHERLALRMTAESLAALFSEDNPRFKRERFLTACGIEG
jgi:hypothetical protein